MLKDGYETVHYADWDDKNKYGVADFDGSPHYFTAKIKTDEFRLSPITDELLELCKEHELIFKKFMKYGMTLADKGPSAEYDNLPRDERGRLIPYFPEDTERGLELKAEMDEKLKLDDGNYVCALAKFQPSKTDEWPEGSGSLVPMVVKWTLVQ